MAVNGLSTNSTRTYSMPGVNCIHLAVKINLIRSADYLVMQTK